MLNETQLQEIENAAVELARGAGKLLLDYFEGPLTVDYKSANNRNPVTDADHASDEYLRSEIASRFPDHGIVSEESSPDPEHRPDVVWVIDPLDGTSNYLNGVQFFCVLIGVLERGTPVAAAIFLPDISRPEGRVLHARAGGGAFDEDVPLVLGDLEDGRRPMSTWPSYFLRMFAFRKNLRRRLGDVRSFGSSGYELALASRGILDFVVFNGLWSWDLAAGLMLVREAGGSAMQYDRGRKRWLPFERFTADRQIEVPSVAEVGKWRGTVVVGRPAMVSFITAGLVIPAYRWRRLRTKVTGWIKRTPSQAASTPAALPPEARGDALVQSQGQGRSRRE